MDSPSATIRVLAHALPEAPPLQPDVAPTGVPPERPVQPGSPDAQPGGTPPEAPVPGLPPEIGPGATPSELPLTGASG